jgi:hypothetical protein
LSFAPARQRRKGDPGEGRVCQTGSGPGQQGKVAGVAVISREGHPETTLRSAVAAELIVTKALASATSTKKA